MRRSSPTALSRTIRSGCAQPSTTRRSAILAAPGASGSTNPTAPFPASQAVSTATPITARLSNGRRSWRGRSRKRRGLPSALGSVAEFSLSKDKAYVRGDLILIPANTGDRLPSLVSTAFLGQHGGKDSPRVIDKGLRRSICQRDVERPAQRRFCAGPIMGFDQHYGFRKMTARIIGVTRGEFGGLAGIVLAKTFRRRNELRRSLC